MKIIRFLICTFLLSCTSLEKNTEVVDNEKEVINTDKYIHNKKNEIKISNTNIAETTNKEFNWEKYEDSLRNQLLESKTNYNLKSSVLVELYIRGLVYQKENKIKFELPFDIHGFDCEAPDCYSTDITFEIPAKNPIVFPDEINFILHEHGCVDNEIFNNGTFELIEVSSEYINYYSKTHLSNLVIIKKGNQLYYFPKVKPNTIKIKRIKNIIDNYDEEDPDAIVPYQSTTMTTYEYERFIENE